MFSITAAVLFAIRIFSFYFGNLTAAYL